MIAALLLAALLSERCPRPRIVNSTPTWTAFDERSLQGTYNGCRRHFDYRYCPSTFYKRAALTYHVLCVHK